MGINLESLNTVSTSVIRAILEATAPSCPILQQTVSDMRRPSKLSSCALAFVVFAAAVFTSTSAADGLPTDAPCNSNTECLSNSCIGYTLGSGNCFVANGIVVPPYPASCDVNSDCVGDYFAFCGGGGYGNNNICYWNGAYCNAPGTYDSPLCPSYTACSNAGKCAAGPGPSQLGRRRAKRDGTQLFAGRQSPSQQLYSTTQALCPASYTACPVKGSLSGGVECLNLQEELNACGS